MDVCRQGRGDKLPGFGRTPIPRNRPLSFDARALFSIQNRIGKTDRLEPRKKELGGLAGADNEPAPVDKGAV